MSRFLTKIFSAEGEPASGWKKYNKFISYIFKKTKGFTLIELLIVIGILAILATTVVMVINPAEMVKQSRDGNRMAELQSINKALLVYQSFGGSSSMGTSNIIYISLPDSDSQCGSYYGTLSATSTGWNYHCSPEVDYRKTDGTGWLPVDLTSVESSSGALFASLPIDPNNTATSQHYYTYIPGSWALSTVMESTKYLASNATSDGGQSSTRFEVGNDLSLNSVVSGSLACGHNAETEDLVNYWKFDDGTGSTTVDYYGSNDGTLFDNTTWTTGKVENGLSFDNAGDYVKVPLSDLQSNKGTIAFWMKPNWATSEQTGSDYHYLFEERYLSGGDVFSIYQRMESAGFKVYSSDLNITLVDYTAYEADVWRFIVVTWDATSGQFKLFVNGELEDSSDALTTGLGDIDPYGYIGSRYFASGYFDGLIDEFAIYNEALTPTEITTFYNRSNGGSAYCQ
jgi:prepilin-type N-terminal cleavage/methylation domain-containing protein